MVEKKVALSLLFDRPKEPIFKEKGEDGVMFDVPQSFIAPRFADVATVVESRFGDDSSPRMTIANGAKPDTTQFTKGLARDTPFSLWVPRHSEIAGKLINLFMSQKTVDDLISVAAYVRDRINTQLFNYALSVALLHRKDTKDVKIPSFVETFPDKFVDPKVIRRAREDLNIMPQGTLSPILIPTDYTASNLDPEHKLWYFREDVGANLHHWHWHLVYPFRGNFELVNKDRRGEIFYYMHQQITVRYYAERLSNNLGDVERLSNFRAPIPHGYFPKLDTLVANRAWPSRPDGAVPSSVIRPADNVILNITDMERHRDNFLQVIRNGFAVAPNGQRIPLNEETGIDILGNMMESSILTPNEDLYGNLHNSIHNLIAYSHDPNHRHLEDFGVIGDSTTAMRDPVFYRVHAYVNDIFILYKDKLTPYTTQQLTFPGINVTSLQTMQASGRANSLNTHWKQSDINLSRGLDFSPRGDVFARFTHLMHVPYSITMTVNNTNNSTSLGMARIFMAPKIGFNKRALSFDEQRMFMIELDRFVVQLRPGQNNITRRSTESSVTIPFEQTFRNLDRNRPAEGTSEELEYQFCGCGWPNHMLIPKGTPSGMKFDLFVMISNYEEDRVDQDLAGSCNTAASYCGIRDRKYPDRKAMGYPFDRKGRSGVNNLFSFLTPNMRVQEITITYVDKVVQRN